MTSGGQLQRVKVRVRWYDYPQTGSVPVFLEIKSKRGICRFQKEKIQFVACEAAWESDFGSRRSFLSGRDAGAGRIGILPSESAAATDPDLVSAFAVRRTDSRQPGLAGLGLRSTLIDPKAGRREGTVRMEGGCDRDQGAVIGDPTTLQSIRDLGTDWSRYSK